MMPVNLRGREILPAIDGKYPHELEYLSVALAQDKSDPLQSGYFRGQHLVAGVLRQSLAARGYGTTVG